LTVLHSIAKTSDAKPFLIFIDAKKSIAKLVSFFSHFVQAITSILIQFDDNVTMVLRNKVASMLHLYSVQKLKN
jgi:hypothetical protein